MFDERRSPPDGTDRPLSADRSNSWGDFGEVGRERVAFTLRPSAAVAATLPRSRTRAIYLLALFAGVQLADGVATLAGVGRFGPSVEANPILASAIVIFGAVPTLLTAKLIGILLGAVIYARAQYLVMAILLLVYVLGAIDAWALMPW